MQALKAAYFSVISRGFYKSRSLGKGAPHGVGSTVFNLSPTSTDCDTMTGATARETRATSRESRDGTPSGLLSAPQNPFQRVHGPVSVTTATTSMIHTGAAAVVQSAHKGTRASTPRGAKKTSKDPKIHLPGPAPSVSYLQQAALEAEVMWPPTLKLVVLDLNGTLLHRPNRSQPKRMVARPFLQQFLAYLFDNFAVMVWSSARPENVKALVEAGLGDHANDLVACWGRDTLGLDPKHYNMNVQCYKDLNTVWSSEEIQRHAYGFVPTSRFGQRNTILIDDSSLKAAAQPHNLVEIPEFKGADVTTTAPDILAEVVGYLEVLKMQEDVSKFIHKVPFRANGIWRMDWDEMGYALA